MSKFESKNIKYGKSYVLGVDENLLKKQQALIEAEAIIKEAKQQAAAIIEQGKVNAENFLKEVEGEKEKALQDANAQIEKAKKDGFQQGYSQGLKQVTTEMENKVLMIDKFTKVTLDIKKKLIKSAHYEMVDLILEIVKKISVSSLKIDRNFLVSIVGNAIDKLPEKEFVTISINPKLAEKLYEISPDLKEKLNKAKHIKFIENPSLAADGAIVESGDTRIDTRLSTQLSSIETALKEHLSSYTEDDLVKMAEKEQGIAL